ncbi:flavin-dependent thymidylate synthase [uncultured phage cr126_1]|jgi:thymidylate synthase (FAD)|uniref:Flavin-dependent thymidylate synthase n=1 Tax=uncultured phage cr126_1 TaxID=2772075 RepID=A0A7M1RYN2_9CAUD|nr:flavin-dependent thymidylate synthase [uncultured phage cr126_1]QOR59543.1 flavin-dependent thymidylate synthase [uncultured phage cr126_1]
MRIIKPSFEIWDQEEGLEGIYKQIERAGRVCYKSEDKITEDSAKEFVERMIKSGHGAMLEHGTVYLKIPYGTMDDRGEFSNEPIVIKYIDNPYSVVMNNSENDYWYITSNYRVIIENGWIDDLQYLCEPTEFHAKRITVHFVCDRGVSHEFVRHRVMSFAQESTRYCNYSKDKFGNELTYICPCWLDYDRVQELTEIANRDNKEVYRMGHDESLSMEERGLCSFVYDMSNHEHGYLFQISVGWKPQEARAVLPNALKTELVMTGFVSDWEHFFKLRDAGSAHPQARELVHPLHEEFKNRNLLK